MKLQIPTIKHNVIVLGLSLLISLGIILIYSRRRGPSYKYAVFHASKGWGYDISRNNAVIIHQENIPVISRNRGFDSREEAQTTALLIIRKLQENQLPTLSLSEIERVSAESSNR